MREKVILPFVPACVYTACTKKTLHSGLNSWNWDVLFLMCGTRNAKWLRSD